MLDSKRSTSHHLHLFASRCFTLLPACLYQKDERALPGNLKIRKLCDVFHPLTVISLPLTELPPPTPFFFCLCLTENDNWFPVPGAASCYFPIELQGEYAMQSSVAAPGGPVQYSQINITAEAILPIWGHCHRRLGNSVILTDRWLYPHIKFFWGGGGARRPLMQCIWAPNHNPNFYIIWTYRYKNGSV